MVIRATVVLLCLALFPLKAFAQLTATLDRNPVLAGEFFNLTIHSDKVIRGQQPDTDILLKNFVVGPVSTQSNTRIINGQMSQSTQWRVELMARNPGEYEIPSFQVGNNESQPLTVKVIAADKQQQNQAVFIKTSMSETSLYVQQAGVYTLKLYLAHDLTEANLGSPELQNANISQLGKQREGYEIIDGVRYLVVEKDYLVQPQKSGKYTIKSPYFKGRIRENYRTRAVSALGDDIQLEIKPIPDSVSGNWLPSELVTLNEEFQPAKGEYSVGEPITRTITLTALGITKEQLPEINLQSISGVRSYSDQAENNHLVRNGKVISQKVEAFALMPQAPGTYTLPEISIPWFNVITKRLEYAKLPEQEITVIGDPNFAPTAPVISPSAQIPVQSTSDLEPINLSHTSFNSPYYWAVAGIGYLLWLVTLLIVWLRKKPALQKSAIVSNSGVQNSALEELKQAIKQDNHRLFYHGLTRISTELTGSADLSRLTQLVNKTGFSEQISQLQSNLYSDENKKVNLATLYQSLAKLDFEKHQKSKLDELY